MVMEIAYLESVRDDFHHHYEHLNPAECWGDSMATCPHTICDHAAHPSVTSSRRFPSDLGNTISELGNFRPLQPLGRRSVYSVGGATPASNTCTAQVDPAICAYPGGADNGPQYTDSTHWSYDRCNTKYGPAGWGTSVENCGGGGGGGEEFSPIDLCDVVVQPTGAGSSTVPTPTHTGFDAPRHVSVRNTGHTIEVTPLGTPPTTTMAHVHALVNRSEPDTAAAPGWVMARVHFRWGRTARADEGSEHWIDGVQMPLEAHFIHYNPARGTSVDEALATGKKDALMVYAVLFSLDVAGAEPALLPTVANEIYNLKYQVSPVSSLVQLSSFVDATDGHYVYGGSLTTPGCNAVVSWVVQRKLMAVSRATLQQFYTALSSPPGAPVDTHECHLHKIGKEDVLMGILGLTWVSVLILFIFLIENVLHMVSLGARKFFTDPFMVLDIVVVSVAFAFEIIEIFAINCELHGCDNSDVLLNAQFVAVLIFARVWRFAQFGHGLYVVHEGYEKSVHPEKHPEKHQVDAHDVPSLLAPVDSPGDGMANPLVKLSEPRTSRTSGTGNIAAGSADTAVAGEDEDSEAELARLEAEQTRRISYRKTQKSRPQHSLVATGLVAGSNGSPANVTGDSSEPAPASPAHPMSNVTDRGVESMI